MNLTFRFGVTLKILLLGVGLGLFLGAVVGFVVGDSQNGMLVGLGLGVISASIGNAWILGRS